MVSTQSSNISYSSTIEMKLEYNNNILNIERNYIQYIYINYNYESSVLPIIYVNLRLPLSIYSILNQYRDIASIFLTIKRTAIDNKTSISKVLISDHFSFISEPVGAMPGEDLNKNSEAYMKVILGLISIKQQDQLRTSFNGIYKNINTNTLIASALSGMNPVIEKLTNNVDYSSIIIPPLSSVKRYLDFLNNKNPFYTTGYRFFIDFDKCYLLSKSGKSVSAGDNEPANIIFNIDDITTDSSMINGITISNIAYTININPLNINIIKEEAQTKTKNKIITINENNTSNIELDYGDTSFTKSDKAIFIRSNDSSMLKNEAEMGLARIEIGKTYADCNIFTPNKTYNIKNFSQNAVYNGNYILSYKKVVFTSTNNDFTVHSVIGLTKIGKLEEFSGNVYTKSINKAVSSSSVKTSTANKKDKANSRKAR